MMVSLIATTPCYLCGYKFKVVRVSEVRVNKRSLRETGVSLVMTGPRGPGRGFPPLPSGCPECGEHDSAGLMPVSRYRLHPEDERKVAEYRGRKWPEVAGAGS
jgi:hypothetical protein